MGGLSQPRGHAESLHPMNVMFLAGTPSQLFKYQSFPAGLAPCGQARLPGQRGYWANAACLVSVSGADNSTEKSSPSTSLATALAALAAPVRLAKVRYRSTRVTMDVACLPVDVGIHGARMINGTCTPCSQLVCFPPFPAEGWLVGGASQVASIESHTARVWLMRGRGRFCDVTATAAARADHTTTHSPVHKPVCCTLRVLAQLPPVVPGDQHQRRILEPEAVELGHHGTEQRIAVGDRRVVPKPKLLLQVERDRLVRAVVAVGGVPRPGCLGHVSSGHPGHPGGLVPGPLQDRVVLVDREE